jgi:hypothetical protein
MVPMGSRESLKVKVGTSGCAGPGLQDPDRHKTSGAIVPRDGDPVVGFQDGLIQGPEWTSAQASFVHSFIFDLS